MFRVSGFIGVKDVRFRLQGSGYEILDAESWTLHLFSVVL